MKLEVGKKYVRGDDVVVEIMSVYEDAFYSVVCEHGITYTKSGHRFGKADPTSLDLISEYVEPTPYAKGCVRAEVAEAWVKELELEVSGLKVDMQTMNEHWAAQLCEMQVELDAFKPKVATVYIWINEYVNYLGKPHTCRKDADNAAMNDRIGVLRIGVALYTNGSVMISDHKEDV